MSHEYLTGRTRYRTHKPIFGEPLVVLQVEIDFGDAPHECLGRPIQIWGTYWRDARVQDLNPTTTKETHEPQT